MKLIIGLGNPGEEYKNTRHSAGYMVVDQLKKISKSANMKILKSDTFMNDSGKFVKQKLSDLSLQSSDLYVVHDDLDIPLGKFKIQFGRGPKDHNGLKSVDEELGTQDYWHVRVGVDNRPQDNRPLGEVYTLENFTEEEKVILDKTIKEVSKKIIDL